MSSNLKLFLQNLISSTQKCYNIVCKKNYLQAVGAVNVHLLCLKNSIWKAEPNPQILPSLPSLINHIPITAEWVKGAVQAQVQTFLKPTNFHPST